MNVLRWLFWAICFILRLGLIIIGIIFPIHIGYDTPRTKGMNLLERYWENCWRNPTPYLRGIFKQPIPEVKPNPDELVRSTKVAEAIRVMVEGPYIEYWKLSSRKSASHPYFEIRIGWKFVDGDDTFWPTLQIHKSK